MYRHIHPITSHDPRNQYYTWSGECLMFNITHDQGRPIKPILRMAQPCTLSSSSSILHDLKSQYYGWLGEWLTTLPKTSTVMWIRNREKHMPPPYPREQPLHNGCQKVGVYIHCKLIKGLTNYIKLFKMPVLVITKTKVFQT
jgi:hypothetical protein